MRGLKKKERMGKKSSVCPIQTFPEKGEDYTYAVFPTPHDYGKGTYPRSSQAFLFLFSALFFS